MNEFETYHMHLVSLDFTVVDDHHAVLLDFMLDHQSLGLTLVSALI
jgi:hypothetical protein